MDDLMPPKKRLLSAIDIITIGFCSWIIVYMLIGFTRAVDPLIHLPRYATVIAMVFLLAWWERSVKQDGKLHKVLQFVRGI